MASVEDEWEREMESDEDLDLLFVKYDSQQTNVERLVETIAEHGFQAKVIEEVEIQETVHD